ncbi:MAG: hypothetical protein VX899_07010 [Myxococcota bacterium]|nr:hypothetical protein [Myxococcota bacterium]
MAHQLPPPPRQLWLLEQLDQLQSEHGRERLVASPLAGSGSIRTRSQDADGLVGAMAGLLQHVGLGQLKIELEVHPTGLLPGQEGTATAYRHQGTWFIGIEGGRARFGADRRGFGAEPGALAHQVAHAWRAFHGLNVPDPDMEEILTEITAIYLGLGLLTLADAPTGKPSTSLGSLTLSERAFVLGAILASRELPRRQLRQITEALDPAQAQAVEHARQHFRGKGRRALMELLLTPEETEEVGLMPALSKGASPVRRVQKHRGMPGLAIGLAAGLGGALIGFAATGNPQFMILAPFGSIAGGLGGWTLRTSRCSSCGHALGEDDVLCGGCGGLITTND